MNPKQFKLFYKHAGGKGGRYWSLIFHSFKNPFRYHFYFPNLGSRTSSFQCNANTSSLCPFCLLCLRVLPRPGRVHGPRADWGRSPGKHAWIPARCSAGAFKQISHFRNLFPLKLSIASIFPLNRAAALSLSLGLALLPPFRVWALAWQKHRWRITKNILKKSKSMLEVNHGVRQVVLCKDGDGKIGLRVKAVNKGSTRFGSRLLSLVSCRCVCLSCHQGLSSCPWRPQVWRPTPPGGRRQPGWILIWQGALLSVYI